MHRPSILLLALALVSGCPAPEGPPETEPVPQRDVRLVFESGDTDITQAYEGQVESRTLVLTNLGQDTAGDLSVELSGEPGFSIDEPPAALLAGESVELTWSFSPTVDGFVDTELTARARDAEPATLVLSGSGVMSRVLAPESVVLPAVPEGCTAVGSLVVGATASTTIERVELLSEAPFLQIEEVTSESIGGGEELTIEIVASPNPLVPTTSTVRLTTLDPVQPVIDIPIHTQSDGSAWTTVQDTLPPESLDILFVIDSSSCSNTEQQVLSLATYEALGQDFPDLSWQAAVTTADTNDGGLFVEPGVIDSDSPDAAATASTAVLVGGNGAGVERGLDGALLALSEPNLSGPTAPLLRKQTPLAIILMSDEPDQSGMLAGGDGASYAAYFQSLKPDPQQVIIHDITGGLTGCSSMAGTAMTGVDYVAATDATGGVSGSVCSSDLRTTLGAQITESLRAPRSLALPESYMPGSLQVQVVGTPGSLPYTETDSGPLLDTSAGWDALLEMTFIDQALCPTP